MTALAGAVELLERSLAYTRGRLADVRGEHLSRPTPCSQWDLAALLAHMDDALDAFVEASAGRVEVEARPPGRAADAAPEVTVAHLQAKACALLSAWLHARPDVVGIGELDLDAPLLVGTAALEITVHGWDVGQATGCAATVPDDLADGLLGLAHLVIGAPRRPAFAAARPVPADTAPGERLLAWTGRGLDPVESDQGNVGVNRANRDPRRGLAS